MLDPRRPRTLTASELLLQAWAEWLPKQLLGVQVLEMGCMDSNHLFQDNHHASILIVFSPP